MHHAVTPNTSVSRLDVSEEMKMENPEWLQNTSSEREITVARLDLHILTSVALNISVLVLLTGNFT